MFRKTANRYGLTPPAGHFDRLLAGESVDSLPRSEAGVESGIALLLIVVANRPEHRDVIREKIGRLY